MEKTLIKSKHYSDKIIRVNKIYCLVQGILTTLLQMLCFIFGVSFGLFILEDINMRPTIILICIGFVMLLKLLTYNVKRVMIEYYECSQPKDKEEPIDFCDMF